MLLVLPLLLIHGLMVVIIECRHWLSRAVYHIISLAGGIGWGWLIPKYKHLRNPFIHLEWRVAGSSTNNNNNDV